MSWITEHMESVRAGEKLCSEMTRLIMNDDQGYTVFLFSEDNSINEQTVRHLPVFRERENVSRFLLVTSKPDMEAMINSQARVPYELKICSEQEAHDIGRYCTEVTRWEKKSKRILINGTDDSEEYRYRGLIGFYGISAADIVAISIFDLGRTPGQEEIDRGISFVPSPSEKKCPEEPVVWETEAGSLDDWEVFARDGALIYSSIRSESPDTRIYMCTYPGTGDIYLTGLYLRDRMRHDKVSECVFVVASESSARILRLFHLDDIIRHIYVLKGRPECNNLLFHIRNMGFNMANAGLISNDYGVVRLERMSGINGIDFNTLFQKVIFFSDEKRIKADIRQEDADDIFEAADLLKGRTVVLSPYANTTMRLSEDMWVKIVSGLSSMGYSVCTNVAGDLEKAIEGTVPVYVPYEKIIDFVEKAGGFIGLRSGLCDLISGTEAKKVILYPPGVIFHNTDYLNYFSLKKMYDIKSNLMELVADDAGMELVAKILCMFKGDTEYA